MFRLHSELIVGDITGAPMEMRPNLSKMPKGSFLEIMLLQKPTTNPEADYFYICLFQRDRKDIKEVNYPSYRRMAVERTSNAWKPFKGKESSIVIMNRGNIVFPRMVKTTLVNYVGICDYTGKLFCLAKVEIPFMGMGHVFFGRGDLVIRAV